MDRKDEWLRDRPQADKLAKWALGISRKVVEMLRSHECGLGLPWWRRWCVSA